MAKKMSPPPPQLLVATIREIEQTYYISEEYGELARVDDEAIVDIVGEIEDISPAQKRFLGQKIEMSFISARSFSRKDPGVTIDKPFLLPIQLRKDRCSLMAYLPADAFWALPNLISSGAVTHIEARFAKPHYGTGDLLSVYFAHARLIRAPAE